jgi:hypothetical protein
MLQKEKNNWDDMITISGVDVEGAQQRNQERPIFHTKTGKMLQILFSDMSKAPTAEWTLFVRKRGTFTYKGSPEN